MNDTAGTTSARNDVRLVEVAGVSIGVPNNKCRGLRHLDHGRARRDAELYLT